MANRSNKSSASSASSSSSSVFKSESARKSAVTLGDSDSFFTTENVTAGAAVLTAIAATAVAVKAFTADDSK